jgi:hypothetical protein
MIPLRPAKITTVIFLLLLTLFTTGCFKSVPYKPSELAAFDVRAENIRLEFETDQGRQVAFYMPPLNSPEKLPEQINIIYPGINAVTLGWQRYIYQAEDPDSAYLLIDYPGSGLCEGSMRPEKNYLNTEGALDALAKKYGKTKLDAELHLVGHSFGSGAALNFAERARVSHIVLISPFNTLTEAVAVRSWLLSLIFPSEIDNKKILRALLQSEHPPKISILHGSLDTVLPVTMGRDLATVDPEQIDYYEFAEDGHVDILTARRDMIFHLLNGRDGRIEASLKPSDSKRPK